MKRLALNCPLAIGHRFCPCSPLLVFFCSFLLILSGFSENPVTANLKYLDYYSPYSLWAQRHCLHLHIPTGLQQTEPGNGSCSTLANPSQKGKLALLLFCFHDFQQSVSQKEETGATGSRTLLPRVAAKGTKRGTHSTLGTLEREELEEWDPRQTRTLGRRNLGSHGTRQRRWRGYPDFGTEGLRVSLPACRWGGPQCRRDVTLHRELQGVGAHPHRGAQRAQQGSGRLVRAVLPAAGLGRSSRGDGEEHGASGLPLLDRRRSPTAPRFSFSWDAFVVI